MVVRRPGVRYSKRDAIRVIRMQMKPAILAVLATGLLWPAAARAEQWDFDNYSVGKLPAGWSAAKTGEGPGSVWKVSADRSAPSGGNVLAQTSSDGPDKLFNLCVADGTSYTNLELSVRFKAISGKNDQGGGLVWHYRDADNYYVARMNPLESNFRVYKVVKGQRKQLESADVQVPVGKWHQLKIEHAGKRIRCYLGDNLHLEATDDTFSTAGQIGLWTKSDAVTSFDDLEAKPLDP
jgi:hypothetical protein